MTKLTKKDIKDFIERRYPYEKIIEISMIDDRETMAFVLTYCNTIVVNRLIVDIHRGDIDLFSRESADFREIWNRSID